LNPLWALAFGRVQSDQARKMNAREKTRVQSGTTLGSWGTALAPPFIMPDAIDWARS